VKREVYNILIEFGLKILSVIKMCLNERCIRVGHVCYYGRFETSNAVLPLLFTFPLVYAIRRVQVNRDDLKLNDTPQVLVCADGVNMFG
jgi:hypothetical protein